MMFITFEGVECSGKSLQSALLLEYCNNNNIPAILVREPGATVMGEKLRNILLNEYCTPLAEFFILSAARTHLTTTIIKPNLINNVIVISDRYFHSSLAYQGYGRGLSLEQLKSISQVATLELQPTHTFLLSPSYETSSKRLHNKKSTGLDRIEQEDPIFHKKIYDGYIELAKQYDYISTLNGDLTPEEIQIKIIHQLNKFDPRFQ